MSGFVSRISRHAGLVNKMADTLGVDLVDEVVAGTVPEARLREAVGRCMNCSSANGCERWLEEHHDGASAAPVYCRNNDMWDKLTNDL